MSCISPRTTPLVFPALPRIYSGIWGRLLGLNRSCFLDLQGVPKAHARDVPFSSPCAPVSPKRELKAAWILEVSWGSCLCICKYCSRLLTASFITEEQLILEILPGKVSSLGSQHTNTCLISLHLRVPAAFRLIACCHRFRSMFTQPPWISFEQCLLFSTLECI